MSAFPPGFLSDEDFFHVVRHAPLVAIDLIVTRNNGQEVLLGERRNPPAQGWWFVPGGRIRKGETHAAAFQRITLAELGVRLPIEVAHLLGSWAHLYPQEAFQGLPVTDIHYVTLGYHLERDLSAEVLPVEQHSAFRWFPVGEALEDPEVHRYTKWYLEALTAAP